MMNKKKDTPTTVENQSSTYQDGLNRMNLVKQKKRSVLILSLVCFGISLCLSPFNGASSGNEYNGFTVLLLGTIQVFHGGAALVWIANPILFIAWLYSKNSQLALRISIVSSLIMLAFLFFDGISNGAQTSGTDYQTLLYDLPIKSVDIGYYFWLMSSLLFLVGQLWILKTTVPSPSEAG